MNIRAAGGEKQDEERYSQFWELSRLGEQYCFQLVVVCLRDGVKTVTVLDRRELQ